MILYGIKNCDTVKKARRWLEANDVAFDFHDVRADGLDKATIEAWLQTGLVGEYYSISVARLGVSLDDPRKDDNINEAIAIETYVSQPDSH